MDTQEQLYAEQIYAEERKAERAARAALYDDLAKARAKFGPIKKSRTAKVTTNTGGSYSYQYADLSDMIDSTIGPLTEHGLSLIQTAEVLHDGVEVNAVLVHRAGYEMHFPTLRLPIQSFGKTPTPQMVGSAITYARRYQYAGIFNLAAEEDDDANLAEGNSAQTGGKETMRRLPSKPVPKVEPKAKPSNGKAPAHEEVPFMAPGTTDGVDVSDAVPAYDGDDMMGWDHNWKTTNDFAKAQQWGRRVGTWNSSSHFTNAWGKVFKANAAHEPANAEKFLRAWFQCVLDHIPVEERPRTQDEHESQANGLVAKAA